MNNQNRQFTDQLLDASLDRFSNVEPRAGLEGRILASVAARNRATQRRNWILGLAFSAFALAAFVFAVSGPRHAVKRVSPPAAVATAGPQFATPTAPVSRDLPRVARVRRPSAVSQRPQEFPTPAPLGDQEKMLLVFVNEAPKSVLAASPASGSEDLEIPELKIASLEIKDLPEPMGK